MQRQFISGRPGCRPPPWNSGRLFQCEHDYLRPADRKRKWYGSHALPRQCDSRPSLIDPAAAAYVALMPRPTCRESPRTISAPALTLTRATTPTANSITDHRRDSRCSAATASRRKHPRSLQFGRPTAAPGMAASPAPRSCNVQNIAAGGSHTFSPTLAHGRRCRFRLVSIWAPPAAT